MTSCADTEQSRLSSLMSSEASGERRTSKGEETEELRGGCLEVEAGISEEYEGTVMDLGRL